MNAILRICSIILLLISASTATVEDNGLVTESTWPVNPTATSVVSPGSVWPVPPIGTLSISVLISGPQSKVDGNYIAPGNTLEYIVTVKNEGGSEVDAEIMVDPKSCSPSLFDWISKTVTIPSTGVKSEVLTVKTDKYTSPGEYNFGVITSAPNYISDSEMEIFIVQKYDYISETWVGGTGDFQMDKNVRSISTGIKSNKNIDFSGSVDGLMKNEYIIDQARGSNPNYKECDAVENYEAINPGDALVGSETVKSSMVFGGVGATVHESYDVHEMEYQQEQIDLHHTNALSKRADFQTADAFNGSFLIDARQIIPGQRNIREREEYNGSFEIVRNMVFEATNKPSTCFDFEFPFCVGSNC